MINPRLLALLAQGSDVAPGSLLGDPAASGLLDPSGLDQGPPAAPEYAPPALLEAGRPGYLDRLGVALQGVEQYSPRPYESGGSAFARGLLGGAASGYSGGRLLDMKAREENRATTNKVNVAAADRNYALAMESWKVRLKKYLDENGNVPVNDALIARYPGLAPFRNRTESMDKLLPYMGQQDAIASKPNEQLSTVDDPAVARVLGVKVGTQVKTGDYRQAYDTAHPKPSGGASGQPGMDNVSESIADAIESGLQPPDIKGLYRYGGPVRASLATRKYDLKNANLDWQATQRWVSTANGTQQTRMRQAAATAYESLDIVDQLSTTLSRQIPRGKVKILNRAALVAAQNGLYGPDAQSTATNLQAQITDIVSELGNVYMGGNSPTDHALSLARQNLSSDWSEKQLRDAVQLARTNLKIRLNSIQNVEPIVPGKGVAPSAATTETSGGTAPRSGGFWDKLVNGGR